MSTGWVSDQLEVWLRRDGEKTIGGLSREFGDRSFAAAVLVPMFVPALPLPTGGISHVFEAATVVLGAEMVLGRRTIWLPERWRRHPLGAVTTERAIPFILGWVRLAERVSRPRGARLAPGRAVSRPRPAGGAPPYTATRCYGPCAWRLSTDRSNLTPTSSS